MEMTAENEFMLQYCDEATNDLAHPKFDINSNSDIPNLGLHLEITEDQVAIWDSFADYHGWYLVSKDIDEEEIDSVSIDEGFHQMRKEWKWFGEDYEYLDIVIEYMRTNKHKDVKEVWKDICAILIPKGWKYVKSIHEENKTEGVVE